MNFHIADFKAAYGKSSQIPPSDLPEIVFSGKSNVGKSSLINKLIYRKSMARVSAKPGKTATINFFSLKEAYFVDPPGYGYAQVSQSEKKRWAELVEGYFAQERRIALFIQICDMRHTPTANDMDMIDFLYQNGYPTQQAERLEALKTELKDYPDIPLYPCSSENGTGIDEIRTVIEKSVAEATAQTE